MIGHLVVAWVLLCVVSINGQLVEAWGQFLSQFSWDWFVTLTFRDEVNSFRGHRLFSQRDIDLIKRIKRLIDEEGLRLQGVRLLLDAESTQGGYSEGNS